MLRLENSTCHLTLVVPGLLWPQPAMHDLTSDLATPALCALLGKGKIASNTNNWLRAAFGLAHDPAAAPLRLLALGEAVATKSYLCLDPINLAFVERSVTVGDPDELQLTEAEAQALGKSLTEIFAEIGEIQITTPQQWHLLIHDTAPALPVFSALPDFIGRRAEQGLPTDSHWRNLLNEAQVLLHAHPVNQARESRGQARVNSLWPWGGGSLPTDARTAHDVVNSVNPVLQGLATHCRVAVELPTETWQANSHTNRLVVFDCLAQARGRADGMRWREVLSELDANWFAPILRDLRSGQITHLKIIMPAATTAHQTELSRLAMLKFWRDPLPLSALAA